MQSKLPLLGVCLVLCVCIAPTYGAEFEPPRRADGRPDLNGVWQAMSRANFNIEAQVAKPALALRDGPFGQVPAREVVALGAVGAAPATRGVVHGGALPYREAARQQRDENRRHWLERDPEIKCYLPGIPRANYMGLPFQVFQSDGQFAFVYEYRGFVRNVLFDDPGMPPADSWMGQSVGHWEDDTLVIEVSGFNGRTWFDRAGNFHGPNMRVAESFRLIAPDVMHYEATIDDPETFTEPWTLSMNLYRLQGADAQLQQFNCIPFVEELMYGHLRREPLDQDAEDGDAQE